MDGPAVADVSEARVAAAAGVRSAQRPLGASDGGWVRARARGCAHLRDFVSKAFLSAQTLRQISEMRQQYVELLDQIGFLRSGAGLFQRNSGEPVDTVDTGETETGEKTNDITSSGLSAAAAPFAPPPTINSSQPSARHIHSTPKEPFTSVPSACDKPSASASEHLADPAIAAAMSESSARSLLPPPQLQHISFEEKSESS